MTTADEHRRHAEARRDELLAAVRKDRAGMVTVDARRRVVATAGGRKGQHGIVTGPADSGSHGKFLPVDWADGTSNGYHKDDLTTADDPRCALDACHARFDGTTWYAYGPPAAHEHHILRYPPPTAHPGAGTNPVSIRTFSGPEHAAWAVANDRGLTMTPADLRALVFAALAAASGEDCQCCVFNDCECVTGRSEEKHRPHEPDPWT